MGGFNIYLICGAAFKDQGFRVFVPSQKADFWHRDVKNAASFVNIT